MAQKYKCECSWVGTEKEMGADCCMGDYDEMWSNWICPGCGMWWRLEDYARVAER
jgi:hypothetical protein